MKLATDYLRLVQNLSCWLQDKNKTNHTFSEFFADLSTVLQHIFLNLDPSKYLWFFNIPLVDEGLASMTLRNWEWENNISNIAEEPVGFWG